MTDSIADEVCIAAIETVLKPLGTSLRHYMALVKADTIDAMRGVLMAERARAEAACETFISPVTDSEFVNGQSTAAQQIKHAIHEGRQ